MTTARARSPRISRAASSDSRFTNGLGFARPALNSSAIRNAPLKLPGQTVAVFGKTPAPYRLLPEPLLGPIRDCEHFAFEVVDKTYLIERGVGGWPPPAFTIFFDAVAEQIWERVIGNPDAALSRSTQEITDGGETFRRMFRLSARGLGSGSRDVYHCTPTPRCSFAPSHRARLVHDLRRRGIGMEEGLDRE